MADEVLKRDANRIPVAGGVTSDTNEIRMFRVDEDGRLLVTAVSHYKGFFLTPEALEAAYPTAQAGDYAIVGSTDTIWLWDTDTNAWVNSGNTATGDVVGPASATDEALVRFDLTTGKLIQNSTIRLSDTGQLYPATNDAGALGIASTNMWSDIFLANGAVINFNNGNYTLTHSNNLLTTSGPFFVASNLTMAGTFLNVAGNPILYQYETDAGADEKAWVWNQGAGTYLLRTGADANINTGESAVSISRSGTVVVQHSLSAGGATRLALTSSALALTPASLTGSGTTSAFNLTQTLNTTGIVDVMQLNITNTASNVASKAINVKVGGTSVFGVTVGGVVNLTSKIVVNFMGSERDFIYGAGADNRSIYYQLGHDNASARHRFLGYTSGAIIDLLGTGQVNAMRNSAASTPIGLWDGTWFSGGDSTTTKPHFLIEPTGSTSTGWSTSGTGLGINAASGFSGNLIDAQLNGAARFKVTSAGAADAVSYSVGGSAGASGTFTTADAKTVTVTNGIITSIV